MCSVYIQWPQIICNFLSIGYFKNSRNVLLLSCLFEIIFKIDTKRLLTWNVCKYSQEKWKSSLSTGREGPSGGSAPGRTPLATQSKQVNVYIYGGEGCIQREAESSCFRPGGGRGKEARTVAASLPPADYPQRSERLLGAGRKKYKIPIFCMPEFSKLLLFGRIS